MPLDKEGRGLHARLIARLQVSGIDREAVPLRPAAVHPEEHLRPILRLRAARARVERQDGIVRIVLAREQDLELERFKALGNKGQLRADVRLHRGIVLLDAHFIQGLGVLVLRHKVTVRINSALEGGQFLIQLLRRRRIIPEGRLTHLVLELGDLLLLRGDLQRDAHLIELFAQIIQYRFQIFQHSFLKFSIYFRIRLTRVKVWGILPKSEPWGSNREKRAVCPGGFRRSTEGRLEIRRYFSIQARERLQNEAFTLGSGLLFYLSFPWQFLYFFPLPQGHGSLRPTFLPSSPFSAFASAGTDSSPCEARAFMR